MAFAPPGHRQGAYGYPPLAEPPWVSHRYSGAALAAGGAGVSVLAFLFLPYQVFIVALTAPQVIRMNAATDPAWNLVWAVPAVTVALGLLALTELGGHRRRPSSRVRTFTFLRALSAALIGVHLIDIAVLSARDDVGDLSSSVVDLLGVGFWLGFFGVVTAYIGSVIELRNLRRWRRQIGVAAGWW